MEKCSTCHYEIREDCNHNQGRCPHRPQQPFPTWVLLLAAPFFIGAWCIMNPRKVWDQAKKDWNL
jgi:hypothetical protein